MPVTGYRGETHAVDSRRPRFSKGFHVRRCSIALMPREPVSGKLLIKDFHPSVAEDLREYAGARDTKGLGVAVHNGFLPERKSGDNMGAVHYNKRGIMSAEYGIRSP